MNIINVKQLRENFGQVKRDIEEGKTLLLLYRSHPLAEIRPIRNKATEVLDKEERIKKNLKIVKRLAGGFNLGKGLGPEKMNDVYDKSYKTQVLS